MSTTTAPWIRVSILILATAVLGTISHRFTGHVLPADPKDALVFQNALLLIVLGSAFLERHYTKPADSLVNSLMGLITLLSVRAQAPTLPWQIVAGYCTLVFLLSSTCVAVSSGSNQSGWKAAVASFTYRPSVVLGRARLLFTIVFLSGLWFFYSVQSPITLALVIFWGVFLAIWPLKIPELLTSWFHGEAPPGAVSGEIVRIGNPNIVRTRLDGEADWSHEELKICCLPNGKSYWLRPLFSQFQEGTLLATGLLTDIEVDRPATNKNRIIDASESFLRPSDDQVNEALGGGTGSKLVGFIAEGSTIASVRFETLDPECCHDGLLVWAEVAKKRVYYQIVAGETREESFASDKHGYQVASATQLGTLSEKHGFSKFEWLPAMNTPIFSTADATTVDFPSLTEGDFELGVIPKTNIKVGGAFAADYNHHTAILGITGSGKTELAFDLIRNALKNDIKVICIDLTAQYENRLDDLAPQDLSITEEVAEDLAEKLFEV